jgi:hypothetical protein
MVLPFPLLKPHLFQLHAHKNCLLPRRLAQFSKPFGIGREFDSAHLTYRQMEFFGLVYALTHPSDLTLHAQRADQENRNHLAGREDPTRSGRTLLCMREN